MYGDYLLMNWCTREDKGSGGGGGSSGDSGNGFGTFLAFMVIAAFIIIIFGEDSTTKYQRERKEERRKDEERKAESDAQRTKWEQENPAIPFTIPKTALENGMTGNYLALRDSERERMKYLYDRRENTRDSRGERIKVLTDRENAELEWLRLRAELNDGRGRRADAIRRQIQEIEARWRGR
jgi:hypothetical protein